MSKPKESHNGNCTKNARIKIDYSGVKPKVQFSYPDKKHQVTGGMFPYIFLGWFFILIIGCYGYAIGNAFHETEIPDDYNQCVSHYENKFIQEKESIMENLCILDNRSLLKQLRGYELTFNTLFTLILIAACLIPPILIYLPFKKKWNRIYPKFQAWLSSKKLSVFKPGDVRKDEEGYYVEVPLFSNILLNYKATKGFSKHLKFFEIREHKFKYITLGRFKGKKGKDNKKKKQLNEWLWYAKFYFGDKPKTGKLEVIYK